MEFLGEILDKIPSGLRQWIGELLVLLILGALVEGSARSAASIYYDDRPAPTPLHPILAALAYAGLGAGLGALSLHFFPTSLAHATWLRLLNLAVVPVLAGLAMNALGNWRLRHDQTIIRLDRFGYAYLFALALAAVRFFWAH